MTLLRCVAALGCAGIALLLTADWWTLMTSTSRDDHVLAVPVGGVALLLLAVAVGLVWGMVRGRR